MKKVPVTKAFDQSKVIGMLHISDDELPNNASYRFEIGGIIKEKIDNQITKFDLREISLVMEPDLSDLRPKGRNAKHFKLWMRKGKCPGCGVGCGSKHQDNCWARKKLLSQIKEK